jgi:hypothetical protein
MPIEFGLPIHFLKFSEEQGHYRLAKQVNLSGLPTLSGVFANEQYCRRWLATRLLSEFRERERGGVVTPLAGAQFSRFASTHEEYFNFGIASRQTLRSSMAISLIVGCKVDDKLRDVIRFAGDASVPRIIVGGTCERCGLGHDLCSVRAASPAIFLKEVARQEQFRELKALQHEAWGAAAAVAGQRR